MFDELGERISGLLRESPVQDIETNLKAVVASWLDRMNVVMREDFDVQRKLLERANERLAALEARVRELEAGKQNISSK